MGAKDDLIVLGVVGAAAIGGLWLLGKKVDQVLPDMPNIQLYVENVSNTITETVENIVDTVDNVNDKIIETIDNVNDNIIDTLEETGLLEEGVYDTVSSMVEDANAYRKTAPFTARLIEYSEGYDYFVGSVETIQKVLVDSGDLVKEVVADLEKAVDIGAVTDRIAKAGAALPFTGYLRSYEGR